MYRRVVISTPAIPIGGTLFLIKIRHQEPERYTPFRNEMTPIQVNLGSIFYLSSPIPVFVSSDPVGHSENLTGHSFLLQWSSGTKPNIFR